MGEIVAAVKAASKTQQRILFHTDAGQALGKIPVDVNDLGVDYLTIVGHKASAFSAVTTGSSMHSALVAQ